jgi:hypothetical protein
VEVFQNEPTPSVQTISQFWPIQSIASLKADILYWLDAKSSKLQHDREKIDHSLIFDQLFRPHAVRIPIFCCVRDLIFQIATFLKVVFRRTHTIYMVYHILSPFAAKLLIFFAAI